MDYEAEKDLVLNVYVTIYKVIKLEILYSNDTKLLDTIKNDDVDIQYISSLIREDIYNTKNNSDIKNFLVNIENNGLDDKYLIDKHLIMLISLYNSNNLKSKTRDKLILNSNEYKVYQSPETVTECPSDKPYLSVEDRMCYDLCKNSDNHS